MTPLTVFKGIDPATGQTKLGLEHLRQSVRDILTTPIGSRVMRRTYGSRLFKLLDAPITAALLADIRAAVATALSTWEPRLTLIRVRAYEVSPGRIDVDLEGDYRAEPIVLAGILS
jgi:phage baseplate assembly protein W